VAPHAVAGSRAAQYLALSQPLEDLGVVGMQGRHTLKASNACSRSSQRIEKKKKRILIIRHRPTIHYQNIQHGVVINIMVAAMSMKIRDGEMGLIARDRINQNKKSADNRLPHLHLHFHTRISSTSHLGRFLGCDVSSF
jgi:hypothetical protein